MSVFNPSMGGWLGSQGILILGPLGLGAFIGYKLSQWYAEYKSLPEDASIESWPWYKKVSVGWIAKGEGFIEDMKAQWNAELKKEQEIYTSGDAGEIVKYSMWRSLKSLPPFVFVNAIVGTVNWLKHEWERDPWDGLWKTVGIAAGVIAIFIGILAAPATFGGSLLLTAAGIALIASGLAVGTKESYDYTEVKTKKELEKEANDDKDEILYVPMSIANGAYLTYTGMSMYSINAKLQETPLKWKEGYLENHAYPKHGAGMTMEKYKYQGLKQMFEAKYDLPERKNLIIGMYEKSGTKIGIYNKQTGWFTPVEPGGGILTHFPVTSKNPEAYIYRQPRFYSLSPRDHPWILGSGLSTGLTPSLSTNYTRSSNYTGSDHE